MKKQHPLSLLRRAVAGGAIACIAAAGCASSDGGGGVVAATTTPTPDEVATTAGIAEPAPATTAVPATVVSTVDACNGSYEGQFSGDDFGPLTAEISGSDISIEFVSALVGPSLGRGTISESGAIEVVIATGAVASGQLDRGTCSVTGTWDNGDVAGEWVASVSGAVEPEVDAVDALPESSTIVSEGAAPCSGGADFRSQELFLEDFSGDLRCADFSQAELAQATFSNANLDGASFVGTELAQAEFLNSTLRGADLRGASLADPSFVNVDLTGAVTAGATVVQPEFVNTVCPDGTNSDGNGGLCDLR